MKSFYLLILVVVIVYGCSQKEKRESLTSLSNDAGLKLLRSYDCQTCHHKKNELIGPSYLKIADRYKNLPDSVSYLVSKVKHGGTGVWGNVAMNAHPTISEKEIELMIHYILSTNQEHP
jgi:cytochrome c